MTEYICEVHPWHDYKGPPEARHRILCPWCAQIERQEAYKKQKEDYENSIEDQN